MDIVANCGSAGNIGITRPRLVMVICFMVMVINSPLVIPKHHYSHKVVATFFTNYPKILQKLV